MAFCSSYDSGVVFLAGAVASPAIIEIVPISPTMLPVCSKMLFIMYVVVVLPFVPVTPIVVSFLSGYPKYAADMCASAFLVECTCSTVMPSGISGSSTVFSTTIAAAFFSTASRIYR